MRWLMLLLAAALLWGGGQGVYTWATNRTPTAMDCGNFLRDVPDAKWVALNNCFVDFDETIQIVDEQSGRVDGYFVPLRPSGGQALESAFLLLTDEALIDAVTIFFQDDLSSEDLRAHSAKFARNYGRMRHVGGLVQFGIDSEDGVRDALQSASGYGSDFVIIEQNAAPQPVKDFAVFGGGLLVGLAWISIMRRRGEEAETEEPETVSNRKL